VRRGGAARRRERSKRFFNGRNVALLSAAAAVVVAGIVAGAWLLLGWSSSSGDNGVRTAAIVDQLSTTLPNAGFVQRATATLQQNGYKVDYYSGEQTDVDFYRRLPTKGYDVIVFRNHADHLRTVTPEGETFDEVILFTSEPYVRDRYASDQGANRLTIATYLTGGEEYFGISARFVAERMLGDFHGARIIMLGCEGLLNDSTAKAFIKRGASSYVSWNETVSVSHTDLVGERFLQLLLTDGLSPNAAAKKAMEELGPDPNYGSTLLAYPPGA
jgi:hypothetical protein